jgi:hypothetical protein
LSFCIEVENDREQALFMSTEVDLLLKRDEAIAAEAAGLREAHRRHWAQVEQQVERVGGVGAEVDPLLPYRPGELERATMILAQDCAATSDKTVTEGKWKSAAAKKKAPVRRGR